jgi:hypothetical protein
LKIQDNVLFSGYFFLERRTRGNSVTLENLKTQVFSTEEKKTSGASLSQVNKLISDAIATISAVPKTIIQKVGIIQKQTSFISLGTTVSTTSTSWVDVEDAEVYIDLENDYGEDAKVSWEASLKVAHSNGQAFARLYDDTNKIVVLESEISTTDNADFEQASSSNLNFWKGRNLYKVQIKSLNSFEVTYSGGRIKISY